MNNLTTEEKHRLLSRWRVCTANNTDFVEQKNPMEVA